MTRFEKYIIWFNIPMEYIVLIQRSEGIDDLFEDP